MPEQSPAVERENQRKAKSDKEYSDDFPFPVRVIESPDDAKHAREREQKSDDHEAADLQAQRDAARAAERAAKAGEGQEIAAWLAQRPKGEGMCFFASDGNPPPAYNQLRYHDE